MNPATPQGDMPSDTIPPRPSRLVLLALILALGIGLRLLQYAASSSLWIDELFIALNVTRKEIGALLFGPLDYNQVAPIGFLALEKLATYVLGPGELALRFFPTLFSLVSLFLFWRVSRRFLTGTPFYAAIALFAVNPVTLWTARNAKQYSGDIMACLLLLLLALRFREGRDDHRTIIVTGMVGGAAILLSQPAVLVGLGLLTVLLVQRASSRTSIQPLVPLVIGAVVGSAIVAVTSLVLAPEEVRSFMRVGWNDSFVALPWDDPLSLPRLVFQYVAYLFGSLMPDTLPEIVLSGVLTGIVLLGAVWISTRHGAAAAILATPVAVAILAAAVRLLPFSGRVSAYLGPIFLITFSAGLASLREVLPRRLRSLGIVAILGVAATPAIAQLFLLPPFYRREEARPILEAVDARWREGDILYVLHGGQHAATFYGEPLGLVPWVPGGDYGFAPRAYLREIDAFRGRSRVWFFYTHAKRCEPETVLSYLDSIGHRTVAIQDPHDNRGKREAAAFLYDLSDPRRLSRSSAESQPVPEKELACERRPVSQGEIIKRKLGELASRITGSGD